MGKTQLYDLFTEDKINLKIKRHPNENKNGYPVVLFHGLASNKNCLDFGEEKTEEWKQYSLAANLKSFDVWIPELRGIRTYNKKQEKEIHTINRYNWSLNEYIEKDIPAIINFIQKTYLQEKGKRKPILWIGKSMGGMLAYAYGQTKKGKNQIKAAVTMGSPVSFEHRQRHIELLTLIAPRKISLSINISKFLQNHPKIRETFKKTECNPKNVQPEIYEKHIKKGLDNTISLKVLNHFSIFIRHKNFCRYPKNPWFYDIFGRMPLIKNIVSPYSYKQNLYKFKKPILIIAGGGDHLAPAEDIQFVLKNIGSKDITYYEFSKRKGYNIDYGHTDLNLGIKAKEEIYSKINSWLKEKSKE
ncbi:MAG: alpha/beta fold hydrolase [Candidatus Thermoplasmatota archaeon]